MQFRQQALARQQSPEDLDVPAQLARPQGRLVLLFTTAVVVAACVWAVTGTVSGRVTAPGILFHAEGSYTLQSPVTGQVVTVLAARGDTLAVGAPLLAVRTDTGAKGPRVVTVRTVAAGRITTLPAALGAFVSAGSAVATFERSTGPDEPLVAVVYAAPGSAAPVPVGAAVDVTVQGVPVQQYGLLRGHVVAVGRDPETQPQIAAFLGSDELARTFSASGQPVVVVVRLDRSPGTPSGYAWSTTQGPPFALQSTLLLSAAIHLPGQHPIDWILP